MELIGSAVAHAAADPQRVWARLVDGRRWREWSPVTDWMLVEGALAPGSFVTIKRKRGRQTAFRVETADAPFRLALLLTFGPAARLRIAWTLEPEGDGTLIRQTIESGGRLRRWLSDPHARRGAVAWNDDPARLAELAAAG
ncbi:MAG TPA: SRPBCC family protein [Candidatus Lustribacter sp.]